MSKKVYNPLNNVLSIAKTVGKSIHNDGWFNTLTGLGIKNRDSRLGMQYKWEPLSETDLEHLFAVDDIARKIVTYPPREGTRKWIELKILNNKNQKIANDVYNELEKLNARENIRKAWEWSRLYGGAAIFLAVDDGMDLCEPLDLNRIRKINALTVLNRYELSVAYQINNDLGNPNFGLPEYYSLTPRETVDQTSQLVHHSRLIKFNGASLGRSLNQINDYWGDSVLTALLNVIRNYNLGNDSAATAIGDFRTGILKIKDLAQIIAEDKDQELMKRIQIMQYSKSVLSCIALDADSEDFDQKSTALTGVKDVLEKLSDRLVAATEMPHTIILGEGALGTLGGGGQSEDRNAIKYIHAMQEEHLTKPIDYLLEVVQSARQGATRGKIIKDLTWMFSPLSTPSENDKATLHKTQAEADKIYWELGVITSEEIRQNRFMGEEYSVETSVSEDKDQDLDNIDADDIVHLDVIKEIENEYFIYSESGNKKLGGPYKTKKEAEKRLREIEYFKSQGK